MSAGDSPKIFWSWQNDYSPKTCRSFVRSALVESIELINNHMDVNDADRPEIDHDTKGERGMVDIAAAILRKIANSAVFVADLTPIAKSSDDKWLPNPNVMIELGWAMHKPGWERVIGVLNTAAGAEIEDLPFDIRQRRVITYLLAPSADANTRNSVKKKLVTELKGALEVNLENRAAQTTGEAQLSATPANPQNPSIWASAKETFIHNEALSGPRRTEVLLPDVPRSFMRVIPAGWKTHPPSVADIADLPQAIIVEAPSDRASSGNYGATEEGFVRYWVTGARDEAASSTNISMFFEDTGEFWMLHGSVIVPNKGYFLLQHHRMLPQWSQFLRRSMLVLDRFGSSGPRRVEAGLFKVRDLRWPGLWEMDQIQSRRNHAVTTRQNQDWSGTAQISYLTNTYNKVRNLFALPRVPESQACEILALHDPERFGNSE